MPLYYTVKLGETVYSISRKLGVEKSEIIRLNKLGNNMIYEGQKLLIKEEIMEEEEEEEVKKEEVTANRIAAIDKENNKPEAEPEPALLSNEQERTSSFVLDVREADLRDVLSALAIRMERTIIFIDDPVRVTFSIEDVTPQVALRLLLQNEGFDYLEDDDFILVGTPDKLKNDYFDHLALTRFNLQYISSPDITGLLEQLGVDLQVFSIETNPRTIWAQGTPRELGQLREIIVTLDRPENADPETASSLERFDLQYLNAELVGLVIDYFAISARVISFPANPQVLWAQGAPAALERLKELIITLDRPENSGLEVKLSMTQFKLNHLSAEKIRLVLEEAGIPGEYIITDETSQLLWVYGSPQYIEIAREIISTIDLPENSEQLPHIFIYQLQNISAVDASARMDEMGIFNGVKTMTFSYPEISHELLVICPPHLTEQVYSALGLLDEARQRIRMPVDSADKMSTLAARRELLSQLTGVAISRMFISSNLSGDSENPYYILWVEETPDKIQQVRDMVEIIDSPRSGRE